MAGEFFSCGNCTKEHLTLDELKKHYSDFHNQTASFNCGHCDGAFVHKTSLFRHIRLFHQGVDAASASFSSASTSSAVAPVARPTFEAAPSIRDPLQPPLDDNCSSDILPFDNESSETDPAPQVDLNKVATRIIMELRSRGNLTGKAVERFQTGCNKLLGAYRTVVVQKMASQLRENGIEEEIIDSVIMGIPDTDGLFKKMTTIEEQLDVFAQEFGVVIPIEKFLKSRIDRRLDTKTNSFVQTQVNCSFQYIPITSTLEAILNIKKYRENIFKDSASDDDVLRSYVDGSHCKDHPFVKKHGKVIHIVIFFDELEVANALGSKTTIHKLGVFFFQILNGPPEESSKLSSIHLLILAFAEDLKTPRAYDIVLSPFIQEMKKLSSDEGVEITVDGQPFVIRALLTAVTADTLAAHELLGFLSPSARFFCRCCMVNRQQLREDGNYVGEQRSQESHNHQVQEVKANSKASSLYGVKRDCPLNQLPYFHSVESSVFDAFHDLLEGVAPLDVKLVLRHYIYQKEYLSIAQFNVRIESFSYGIPDAKNKPSPNFTLEMLVSKKKLKQTGAQMWCLMRALPFLIADNVDKVEVGDKHMELVFLLQDIMKIVFAFDVSPDDLDQLEMLVFKHNMLFKTLFIDTPIELQTEDELVEEMSATGGSQENEEILDDPQLGEEALDDPQEVEEIPANAGGRKKKSLVIHMINKMHHLKHYGDMMRKFGPAVRLWCAKFEGRLKIFRQHSSVCCNFRNVPKTMAQMFQLSNVIHEDEKEDEVEFKRGNTVRVADMANLVTIFHGIGLDDSVLLVSTERATINGEEYRSGLFVKLPSVLRYSPQFALITKIYVHEKKVYFLVKPWRILCLSGRYNCYRVAPDPLTECLLVDVLHLANFRAIAPWCVTESDDIYLSLRTGGI